MKNLDQIISEMILAEQQSINELGQKNISTPLASDELYTDRVYANGVAMGRLEMLKELLQKLA